MFPVSFSSDAHNIDNIVFKEVMGRINMVLSVDPLYSLHDIFEYLYEVISSQGHLACVTKIIVCLKGSFVIFLDKVLVFNLHVSALFNLGENAV